MSSNFAGLLIILFALLVSVNITMPTYNDPVLLAWLNQIIIGAILIAVTSYVIVRVGTRKTAKKGSKQNG